MNLKSSLLFLVYFAIVICCQGAPQKGHLVKFHPITREQYKSVISLTDGEAVVSEAHLIANSFSRPSDSSSDWQQLLHMAGLQPDSDKSNDAKIESIPLCLIKASDLESLASNGNDDVDKAEPTKNGPKIVVKTKINGETEIYNSHDGSEVQNKKEKPVINCVVVLKQKASVGGEGKRKPTFVKVSSHVDTQIDGEEGDAEDADADSNDNGDKGMEVEEDEEEVVSSQRPGDSKRKKNVIIRVHKSQPKSKYRTKNTRIHYPYPGYHFNPYYNDPGFNSQVHHARGINGEITPVILHERPPLGFPPFAGWEGYGGGYGGFSGFDGGYGRRWRDHSGEDHSGEFDFDDFFKRHD